MASLKRQVFQYAQTTIECSFYGDDDKQGLRDHIEGAFEPENECTPEEFEHAINDVMNCGKLEYFNEFSLEKQHSLVLEMNPDLIDEGVFIVGKGFETD